MNIEYSKTLCVILHYGSEEYTNKCINSLLNQKQLDIVILDNDPSQSYELPIYIKKFAKIFKTGGAAGFSESYNRGIKKFLTINHNSIFILNNDTIVSQNALEYLLNTLNSSAVGAVGPCMPYTSQPNKIWACGGIINKLRLSVGGIQPKNQQPYEVDYLPAAAILCCSDLWKEIGGFNEEYFIAFEEAEFALEIKKRGLKVMADPRSVILHTVGMSNQISAKYYYNSIRNRLIFSKYLYGKKIGFVYAMIVTTLSFLNARTFKNFIQRIKLWTKAISDDFNKIPIDRKILQSITEQFKDN